MSTHKWLKKIAFAILSVLAITLVLAYSITDSYQYEVTPNKRGGLFFQAKRGFGIFRRYCKDYLI